MECSFQMECFVSLGKALMPLVLSRAIHVAC
jgi:hypothetical protein